MSGLLTFRPSRTLLRAVLLWFALSLGAAIAAPLMQPVSLGPICSAAGSDSDQGLPAAHGLQCAACLPFIAPPPAAHPVATPVAVSHAPIPALAACPPQRHSRAVQARGPPARG